MKKVVDSNFFTEIWGFSESHDNVANLISCSKMLNGNIILESQVNSRKVQAGQFEVRMVKDFKTNHPPKHGCFNIIIGNGNWTKDFKKVDVGALQANPLNRGATFQVASNFNCLEFISSKDTARKGITKYVCDQTQGPAASISAAPGTLYRNYFVKHSVDGENFEGQLKQQINLLDLFILIPVVNGYVSFTDDQIHLFDEVGMDFSNIGEIKVGLQKNVQVTSGEKRNGTIEMCPDGQFIHQVFTAAMNLGGVSGAYAQHHMVEKLARFLLRGAYRATILAAIDNSRTQPDLIGKDKLFLTLIGGGVFGNKYEWITDAILECTDIIKKSGLQIYLVIYSEFSIDNSSLERLGEFAGNTGGKLEVVQ